LAIGDIARFRIVVPDPVGFQLRKELAGTLLIKMLNVASTVGCHYLQPLRFGFQEPRHERTSSGFEVAQNPNFVREAFFRLRSAEGLVDPAIIADTNRCSESVFDLVHIVENMAH
jgi:hypothetical protein